MSEECGWPARGGKDVLAGGVGDRKGQGGGHSQGEGEVRAKSGSEDKEIL